MEVGCADGTGGGAPPTKRQRVSRFADAPPPEEEATSGGVGVEELSSNDGGKIASEGLSALVEQAKQKAMQALLKVQEAVADPAATTANSSFPRRGTIGASTGSVGDWTWGTGRGAIPLSRTLDVPPSADLRFIRDAFVHNVYRARFKEETGVVATLKIDRDTNALSVHMEAEAMTSLECAEEKLYEMFTMAEETKDGIRKLYLSEPNPPTTSFMGGGMYPRREDWVKESMTVASDMAGVIIGKRGETIRSLQQDYNCKVYIINADEDDTSSNERTINLQGPAERVIEVREAIQRLVDQTQERNRERQEERERRERECIRDNSGRPPVVRGMYPPMMVKNNHVGIVIGRGGETIRSIEDRFGIRMVIQRDDESAGGVDEREINFNGPPDAVQNARDYILELIDQKATDRQRSRAQQMQPQTGYDAYGAAVGADPYAAWGGYLAYQNYYAQMMAGGGQQDMSQFMQQWPGMTAPAVPGVATTTSLVGGIDGNDSISGDTATTATDATATSTTADAAQQQVMTPEMMQLYQQQMLMYMQDPEGYMKMYNQMMQQQPQQGGDAVAEEEAAPPPPPVEPPTAENAQLPTPDMLSYPS